MKKVGIIRTSTSRQEVETQKNELYNFMISDGCKKEDIVIIGEAGASAIKLDDRYMANMDKVYDLINSGEVDCIYSWALDRIGRNEEFMVKFKNVCIDKKIQLKIQVPTMTLLNPDGTVNSGMEITFSLYITMAKQEMEGKKARFDRGKSRNDAEGKYNGGFIPYGYYVDENGYFTVDPEKADVVRLIFQLYASGKYSTSKLSTEMKDRGYDFTIRHIRSVLSQKAYIGIHSHIQYPQIIDEAVFNKCQEIKKNNNSRQSTATLHWHLGAKLIVCPSCGNHFSALGDSYRCSAKINHYKPCNCSTTISIKQLDSILYKLALTNETLTMQIDRIKSIEKYESEIKVLETKIANLKEELRDKLQKKLSRVEDMYIDGNISKEKYLEKVDKIKSTEVETNSRIIRYENELFDLKHKIEFLNNPLNIYNPETATPKEKYDMVHRNISKVELKRLDKGLEVYIRCGEVDYTFHYYSQRKDKWFVYENGKEMLAV